MRAVWKYDIPITDHPDIIDIPTYAGGDAKPLMVDITSATQDEHFSLWFEVDPAATYGEREVRFFVHGTGHPIDHSGKWVGSVVDDRYSTDLVWHVYAQDVTQSD